MRISTDNMFETQRSLISDQYEQYSILISKQSKGKKLLHASDDPVLSSRIELTSNFIENLKTFDQTGIISQGRAQAFDSSIKSAVDTADKVKELIQQAGSDTLSDSDRKAIAQQLEGYLNVLVNTANSTDGNGNYIYSGFNTTTTPYIKQNGVYIYQGGNTPSYVNIGINVDVLHNESGFKVFGDILAGNGNFTVKAASTNTGSAYTTPGSVTSTSGYVPDTYTLSFITKGDNKVYYQVIGANSGQVIPAPPATLPTDAPEFIPNSDITFNGATIHVNGGPAVGDSFTIAPSQKQNVFDTIQNIIDNLRTPVGSDPTKSAFFHQSLSQASATMDQSFQNFVRYQSEVGTRMIVINDQVDLNKSVGVAQQDILGQLSEADPIEITTKLSQVLFNLQATQDGYLKIQEVLKELLRF